MIFGQRQQMNTRWRHLVKHRKAGAGVDRIEAVVDVTAADLVSIRQVVVDAGHTKRTVGVARSDHGELTGRNRYVPYSNSGCAWSHCRSGYVLLQNAEVRLADSRQGGQLRISRRGGGIECS